MKTIKDEQKALKRLYKETTSPVLQIHLIAVGKSINQLLEQNELLLFDNLGKQENMDKVLNNIDYERINKWLFEKGYL